MMYKIQKSYIKIKLPLAILQIGGYNPYGRPAGKHGFVPWNARVYIKRNGMVHGNAHEEVMKFEAEPPRSLRRS